MNRNVHRDRVNINKESNTQRAKSQASLLASAMADCKPQKKVLLLCGDYMEDYEAMVPFQALQAYGIAVDAVCPGKKAGDYCRTTVEDSGAYHGYQTYTEKPGHNFSLNATFDEVDFSKYDALVIPGGRAPEYLAINESVLNCARQFSDSGKLIAAICHGPLILAAAGLLKGRKCTAYHALRPVLIDAGAHWIEPKTMMDCVSDGNLITGVIYKAHPEYIQLVVKALGGKIAGSDKRILFLCGDFMEDYEVTVPLQSLQALGCHVDAVCPKKKAGDFCPTAVHDFEGDQTYTEKPGHNFILTASYEGLDASSYDALVIPGGRSPEYLALDETVIALVKKFMQSKKPVASICHGQQILAAAGVLKGRKCTAYPAVKLNVVLGGATWLEPDPIDRCYTDENLVTGAAWPGHPQFVSQLMALLGIRVSF
ncbi:protein DJ-1 [Populus alba x Populus x berolinensis]|nr:protein DJ-1 [Populus alba x Populus x berolinensis]